MARRTSAIYRRKFHTDDVRVNFVILHKLSFAVFVNKNHTFFEPSLHYTPRSESLCPAANVLPSHICTSCTSNFRRTEYLEIATTGEIHLEDRNQTCVSTTATFESCGTKTTNGRINLYIKLEKHKLDQMVERNIRISLDKRIAFSK